MAGKFSMKFAVWKLIDSVVIVAGVDAIVAVLVGDTRGHVQIARLAAAVSCIVTRLNTAEMANDANEYGKCCLALD